MAPELRIGPFNVRGKPLEARDGGLTVHEVNLRSFLNEDQEPARATANVPVPVDDKVPAPTAGAPLPAKLNRVAGKALDKIDEILSVPLPDPADASFGNVSRAQSAAANTAIGAQLRADENSMRARRGDDVLPRLLEILAEKERELAAREDQVSQVERGHGRK